MENHIRRIDSNGIPYGAPGSTENARNKADIITRVALFQHLLSFLIHGVTGRHLSYYVTLNDDANICSYFTRIQVKTRFFFISRWLFIWRLFDCFSTDRQYRSIKKPTGFNFILQPRGWIK